MKMEEKIARRESELFVFGNAKTGDVISALGLIRFWSVLNASRRAAIGVVLTPTAMVRK